jgi:hypothetical protein
MRFPLLRLLLCICGLSCGAVTAQIGPDPLPMRPLFIGNSLTYSNDLPGMVAAILTRPGAAPVQVRSVAYPDFGLTEHWKLGAAAAAIGEGDWTLVVLQQGPSSLAESRRQLVTEARWFAREALSAHPAPMR